MFKISSDFVGKRCDSFLSVVVINTFSVKVKFWKDQSLFSFHIQHFSYTFSIRFIVSWLSISMKIR